MEAARAGFAADGKSRFGLKIAASGARFVL